LSLCFFREAYDIVVVNIHIAIISAWLI
jgi:hypothetical protein